MGKFDIEEAWQDLIVKYHIDCRNLEFRKKREIVVYLRRFFHQFEKTAKILLVGRNQTDIRFLLNDIQYPGFETEVLDFDLEKEINKRDYEKYDKVVIVSYYCRKELASLFEANGINAVLIYDYLEINGFHVSGNYYEIFHELWHEFRWADSTTDYQFVDYSAVFFYDRRGYEIADSILVKQMYLQKMIFDCAYVKDFLALEEWIEEYHKSGYEEAERYLKFMEEAKRLLQLVKETLASRDKKDIILFWLDQLEYGEDEEMPYLKTVSDRGITFENAYMSTPLTQPAAKLIFCKSLTVDDCAFKIKEITKENSGVIQFLESTDYRFIYVGSMNWIASEYKTSAIYSKYTPISAYMWDCMNCLINSDKPVFAVVHELIETHNPNVSFGLRGADYYYIHTKNKFKIVDRKEKEVYRKQRKNSCQYLDRQLEFFHSVLSQDCTRIYMSDHGHTPGGRFHTILKIEGKKIKNQRIKALFSYEDFDEIVQCICKEKDVNAFSQMGREFVRIQDVDYYNGRDIVNMMNKDRFATFGMYGYQGVITLEDNYIRFNNGKEQYWNNKNQNKRITKDRLNYLRGLTSKMKIDIEKENKFKYTRCMYRVMERYQKRNADYERKLKQEIQNLFTNFKKSSIVALRGGGYHSFELWNILEFEQRDVIQYIIDQDKKCSVYGLGIPVINELEINNCKIDVIITSSFDYEEEWVRQLQNGYPEITVIGLYQYLKECGFVLKKEFYLPPFTEDDFAIEIPALD